MINREVKTVSIQYFDGVDEYGQELANLQSIKEIEAAFGMISKGTSNNIEHIDATHYILTKDDTITDKCSLIIDNHTYKVIYVNNHRMWKQVFLK